MKIRVALANLPWRKSGLFGVRAGSRWPFTSEAGDNGYINYIPFPFFLAYAASLLKSRGKESRLFDAVAGGDEEKKFISDITDYKPHLLVVETATPSFANDIRIIREIVEALAGVRVALSGPHASVFPAEILRDYAFIDYILIGEYEYTLLELAEAIEGRLDMGLVPGLAYRTSKRAIVNKARCPIDNLDDLPWPEREGLPMHQYNDGFAGLPSPNVQIWTSRGCPFRCIFCLWPQAVYRQHKYRRRNPEIVAEEMEYLVKRYDFRAIYIDDDLFNFDKGHVLDICRKMRQKNISLPWGAMARADFMDGEMLDTLASAGLYAIKYGVESGSQKILDFCRKEMDLDKVMKMIKLTREYGIKVHLTFCLGLPHESRQTVQETLRFISESRPDSLQFSFATPFPGTDYFNYARDNGLITTGDYSDYDGNNKCVVRTGELSSIDLEGIRVALHSNLNS
ncbi:MAG: radical SAM protein [Candidatus Omnitrophota bacterium]